MTKQNTSCSDISFDHLSHSNRFESFSNETWAGESVIDTVETTWRTSVEQIQYNGKCHLGPHPTQSRVERPLKRRRLIMEYWSTHFIDAFQVMYTRNPVCLLGCRWYRLNSMHRSTDHPANRRRVWSLVENVGLPVRSSTCETASDWQIGKTHDVCLTKLRLVYFTVTLETPLHSKCDTWLGRE